MIVSWIAYTMSIGMLIAGVLIGLFLSYNRIFKGLYKQSEKWGEMIKDLERYKEGDK